MNVLDERPMPLGKEPFEQVEAAPAGEPGDGGLGEGGGFGDGGVLGEEAGRDAGGSDAEAGGGAAEEVASIHDE